MEMRDLLEKMMKFAGEKVGQKPGEQWKGSDPNPPGKKLVGDSILKDLSKGPKAKTKEQELAEEFQAFLEAEFQDTVDKRPGRKSDRPHRGHKAQPRYKTIKADDQVDEGNPVNVHALMSRADHSGTTAPWWAKSSGTHYMGSSNKEPGQLQYKLYFPKMFDYAHLWRDINYKEALLHAQQLGFEQDDQGSWYLPVYTMGALTKDKLTRSKYYFGEKPKKVLPKPEEIDESAMSEKDIELQDYRSMSHKEFQTAYKMTKTEWMNKNKALVIRNPNIKKALGLAEGVPYKATNPHPASKDPVVAKVVKQMRPGLGLVGLDMANEAFLYYAYELGKDRARVDWETYYPAIRQAYMMDKSKQAKELEEGWESGPEEYEEPYNDADDAYDRQRQEKIDTEAEKEWAKLPKVSTYKLVGRGPNMEPNYAFGDTEYDTLEQAIEARKQLMADPKTPHPEHIGIQTLTRVVNQTNENSATTPQSPEHAKQMQQDLSKLKTQIPNPDPETQASIIRRQDILNKQAKDLGVDESRGHKIVATKLKDIERSKNFRVPSPEERRELEQRMKDFEAQLAAAKSKKKQVKEYGANQPTGTAAPGQPQDKNIAIATNTLKAATGSTAPGPMIDKALDTAMQGKPMDAQGAKALQSTMNVVGQIAKDPKFASQFRPLAQQVKQSQQKPS